MSKIRVYELAKELNVSRQLIVGDVALLRASGSNIISTARGYVINNNKENDKFLLKTLACKHTKEDMQDEQADEQKDVAEQVITEEKTEE